ncbi:MAG TPA: hypothetical protein DD429_04375 [Clostridiaceae bacterium]|nr:hypothetical protein [Clostridiaceae bacterium]
MKYDDYMKDNEYLEDCESEKLEHYDECDTGDLETSKRKRLIEVEEVLGKGTAETIVEVCIPLCPPAFEVLKELVSKKVIFDALVASKGKVFVNGRILKDIPYKTRARVCEPGCPKISKLTFGDIRHVTAEIPFALCIDVPKAFKGAKVVVIDTDVNSIEIPNHKECIPGKCVAVCEPAFKKLDTCQRRLFKSLTEKDCISVTVKVVKDVIMGIHDADGEPC